MNDIIKLVAQMDSLRHDIENAYSYREGLDTLNDKVAELLKVHEQICTVK